eukprot:3079302-Prymnesium_polylepis.1
MMHTPLCSPTDQGIRAGLCRWGTAPVVGQRPANRPRVRHARGGAKPPHKGPTKLTGLQPRPCARAWRSE